MRRTICSGVGGIVSKLADLLLNPKRLKYAKTIGKIGIMSSFRPDLSNGASVEALCCDPETGVDRRIEYPPDRLVAGNLESLAFRLNKLRVALLKTEEGRALFPLIMTSGYRPGRFNRAAGGAPGSLHALGGAVDLVNVGNKLGAYLKDNPQLLEDAELWAEDPDATLKTGHLHLQIKPPRSGKRFFWP